MSSRRPVGAFGDPRIPRESPTPFSAVSRALRGASPTRRTATARETEGRGSRLAVHGGGPVDRWLDRIGDEDRRLGWLRACGGALTGRRVGTDRTGKLREKTMMILACRRSRACGPRSPRSWSPAADSRTHPNQLRFSAPSTLHPSAAAASTMSSAIAGVGPTTHTGGTLVT